MSDKFISPEEQKKRREEERQRNNKSVTRSYGLKGKTSAPPAKPTPKKQDGPADVIPFKRKDDKE